jgi:hypothetical protein
MDKLQKKSLMIVVNSIEQQLASLRQLLMLTGDDEQPVHKVHRQTSVGAFTNEQEDDMIAEALKLDEKELLMQDIFKQAGQDGEQRQ